MSDTTNASNNEQPPKSPHQPLKNDADNADNDANGDALSQAAKRSRDTNFLVGEVSKRTVALRLLRYLWPRERWDLCLFSVFGLLFLFAGNLATVYTPVIFRAMVNSLDDSVDDSGSFNVIIQSLWEQSPSFTDFLILFLIVQIAGLIFQEIRSALFSPVTQYASRKMSVDAFSHVQHLGARFHTSRKLGSLSRIIDRAESGVEELNFTILSTLAPAVIELFMALLIMGFLLSWWVALIVLGSIALYAIVTYALIEWRMAYHHRLNEADEHANARSADSFMNFETVLYFANEKEEIKRFTQLRKNYERLAVVNHHTLSVLNLSQGFIFIVSTVFIVGLIGFGVQKGESTFGDYVMVFSYLSQFYGRLGWLGTIYRLIRKAFTDIGTMFSLFEYYSDVQDAADAKPLKVKNGKVRFDRVSFSYDTSRQILRDVSFEVGSGKKVALVGGSGSGKTTITRLLCRLYNPNQGNIWIDDQEIHTLQQYSIRDQIGIVPQETALFNETLYYNILYGRPSATPEDINKAVKAAELTHFIASLPDGLNTMVGERGIKVSGGERQRIAIARMVLKKPRILILDEATSSLDSTVEKHIMDTIDNLFDDCTIIAVAHRLSTVANADMILVFELGTITDRGTHEELLSRPGAYKQMWQRQSKQHELSLQDENDDANTNATDFPSQPSLA